MRQNTFFLGTNSLNFMSKINSSLNSSSTITTNNQSSTTSIDYQINSDDEYKLNLNLTGGYFVIDNLLFGIDDLNTAVTANSKLISKFKALEKIMFILDQTITGKQKRIDILRHLYTNCEKLLQAGM